MKTTRVVCRPALAAGFALAGLAADTVGPDESAEPVLTALVRRDDVGVLLLEEEIFDGLAPDYRGRLERSSVPVLIPFPGPAWEARPSAEERVIELLRRAIGYRVKLR
jgi:vacuolar-type H+-ATPase subunit F/Vma7